MSGNCCLFLWIWGDRDGGEQGGWELWEKGLDRWVLRLHLYRAVENKQELKLKCVLSVHVDIKFGVCFVGLNERIAFSSETTSPELYCSCLSPGF